MKEEEGHIQVVADDEIDIMAMMTFASQLPRKILKQPHGITTRSRLMTLRPMECSKKTMEY